MPIGAAIGTAVAGLGGALISGNAQQNAADTQAQLQNQYLANYAAAQDKYRQYLQGVGPQTVTSVQNMNETQTPFITPQFQPLIGAAQGILQGRLSGPSALPQGYASTGIQAIQQANAGALQAMKNMAARRGASGIQSAALAFPVETKTAQQIGQFQSQLPLQERELRTQDIGLASQLGSIFGRGTNLTGRTTSSTTYPQPILPYNAFLPPGPGASGNIGISPLGGALSSMPWLFQLLKPSLFPPKGPGFTNDVPYTTGGAPSGSGDLFE